jgi:hypothetical protein
LAKFHPHQVIGYHSCDREVGLRVINGQDALVPSTNKWDWLGHGIYFWEQDPYRALQYAIECAEGKQRNKVRIKTPFVIGAIIELGNCLDLLDPYSLKIVEESFMGIKEMYEATGHPLPNNKENARNLDCTVIEAVHKSFEDADKNPFDSVRCLFQEGKAIYENAQFFSKMHIQICLRNHDRVRGYFLPLPHKEFNPFLN